MQGNSATETALNATQGRLRHIEANFADVSNERGRLAAALDSATERHDHELSSQRMRFEALQARALATEKLPVGTREHLLAKAEEIRNSDRRTSDIANERHALQTRVADLEADASSARRSSRRSIRPAAS